MRVLMLNERDLAHPLAGGVEVHLEEIASRLASDHGIEMTVLCAGFDGGAPEETRRGIRYVRFGTRDFSYYAMMPGRARAEWARGGYDLVVENHCKLLFFSQLYLSRAPKLALVHHLFGFSAFRQVSAPVASVVVLSEGLLPVAYRRWPFVVVSPSTRDDLVRRGLPRGGIRVVPNGLDHAHYHRDPSVPVDPGLVLFVGRVEHYKGADVLLDAWPRVLAERPEARLVIVGSGHAEAALRERAVAADMNGSVTFRGFVSEEEKVDWLRRATVLVQPSRKEGWGLTVLEANACGTPVVATDVPGLRDSVRDGETGLLAPAGEPFSLADRIVKVLAEPVLRAHLSRGALVWARRFDWKDMAASFAGMVRAAAARQPLPAGPDVLTRPLESDLADNARSSEIIGKHG